MVFDLSRQLDFLVFKVSWREFVFLEELDGASKNHCCERFARWTKVEKISVALRRMTDAKNPTPHARFPPCQVPELLHVARDNHRQIKILFLSRRRQG